ncbi:hypothetical protein [Streptomyces sp. NPDC002521]
MGGKDFAAIQTTRAWTGLLVVLTGDAAIAVGAIWVALRTASGPEVVSILTSAFTAITAITTAYFGIRAATNSAQTAVAAVKHLPSEDNKPKTDDPAT